MRLGEAVAEAGWCGELLIFYMITGERCIDGVIGIVFIDVVVDH